MLPGPLIFPSDINHLSVWITVCLKSKSIQAGCDPRDVCCVETSLDYTELSLQIKIHVMQMSDLQYVRHRYICAVSFLNVDTCTAYCISMHSTAFHRFKLGITTCTDVDVERLSEK